MYVYILWNYCVLYHSYSLHGECHNECAIKQSSFYKVKLALHYYSTCAIKFWLDFLQKILDISKMIFFNWNENKIEINSFLTSALFQSFFDQEIAIEIRQVHNRFIKLPIILLFWYDVQ